VLKIFLKNLCLYFLFIHTVNCGATKLWLNVELTTVSDSCIYCKLYQLSDLKNFYEISRFDLWWRAQSRLGISLLSSHGWMLYSQKPLKINIKLAKNTQYVCLANFQSQEKDANWRDCIKLPSKFVGSYSVLAYIKSSQVFLTLV